MSEQTPAATPPASGSGGMQMLSSAHKYDLGILGAGVLAFIASLLPYYSFSGSVGEFSSSASASAWHGFFGWFGALCALAGAAVLAVRLMGVALPVPVRTTVLALFGVAAVCTILALFVVPGGDIDFKVAGAEFDTGHGFGYWLALLATLAGTVLAVLRRDEPEA